MATARADAWQENSLRYERTPLAARPERRPPPPLPPLPDLPGRAPAGRRPIDRRPMDLSASERRLLEPVARADGHDDDLPRPRRRPAEPSRPAGREPGRGRKDERRPSSRSQPPARNQDAARQPGAAPTGSGLRGFVAVLGVFLVTLAAGCVDWFTGVGLGTITLVALVTSTSIATLVVRRRDMVSVVLSPPLVFLGVISLNIALSPSLVMSLPTVATLLIRGFPTMAVATAAAIILALVRLITRR